ncbi:MAG: response regulator transcription factor [Bacteroidetes bacterium]|nr:response regulator transcription factor [Bacteroidota bacterium]
MITAIAVDDEPLALEVINTFCKEVDFIELQKTFTETAEALKYIKKYPVDLLFLDIKMPAMSGIDFYKSIFQNTMVIFTTAYTEYAVEGFNLSAVDYLLKPFEQGRFMQAVEKARDYYNYKNSSASSENKYLYIRADYSLVKLALDDILYIEGLDNYLKIHLVNAKPVIARMSMKSMADKLPEKNFVRVHRSYIVPLDRIIMFRNKTIYVGAAEIPVGTSYMDVVQQLFENR